MPSRGRVKHVVYDLANPQHVRDLNVLDPNLLKIMDRSRPDINAILTPLVGDHIVIQYFEGKPVGYATFYRKNQGRELVLTYINILPKFRDTDYRPPLTPQEAAKLEATKKKIAKFASLPLRQIPKRVQRQMRGIMRAEDNLAKRQPQIGLSRKMVRWLANRYSSTITGTSVSPAGRKLIDRYTVAYTPEYFKRKNKSHKRTL